MPFAVPPDFRDEAVLARQKAGWAKNIGEPGWIADWGGLSDGVFVAHISLKGGSIEADQHRALVQLGVERAHQSQHLATRMLQEVIEFSKPLDWRGSICASSRTTIARLGCINGSDSQRPAA